MGDSAERAPARRDTLMRIPAGTGAHGLDQNPQLLAAATATQPGLWVDAP